MIDDDAPVTRAALREELARYPTREELKKELARFATKDELGQVVQVVAQQHETLLRALGERLGHVDQKLGQLDQKLGQFDLKLGQFDQRLGQFDQRLGQFDHRLDQFGQLAAERHEELLRKIARSARVAAEEHRRELGVLDDRYRQLPGRVTTLEREIDEHRRDSALHSRPRRPPRPR